MFSSCLNDISVFVFVLVPSRVCLGENSQSSLSISIHNYVVIICEH